jgi:chondroitin 4-sulfotransferase 11
MTISISGENDIAFLHIPKTAGTSIEEWLNLNKGSRVYREFVLNPKLSSLSQQLVKPSFTFTVVRNPWDRMVSFYHWIKWLVLNDPQSLIARSWLYHNHSIDNWPEFDSWIQNLDSFAWFPTYLTWFSPSAQQTEWIDQPIDLIVRFENLEADLAPVRDLLATSAPLPHRRRSDHYPYKQYYTDETKQIIAQRFQQDIDLFKYTF